MSRVPCGGLGSGSEETYELADGEACSADKRSKSAFGKFFVVGDREAPVRRLGVTKDNVASLLGIHFIADPAESFDRLCAGNDRQFHPAETSMTSSSMPGGIGSWCFRRLCR